MSATLHTTLGDIKVELYCDLTPRTSHNFLGLAAAGYYDGTKFHRNIKGFMIQASMPSVSVVLSTSSTIAVFVCLCRAVIQQEQVKVERVYGVVHLVMSFILMQRMTAEAFLRWLTKELTQTGMSTGGGHLMGGCVAPT
jgi:cyclophilin family peptidyl-prolyl cis-trans isomerase